MDTNFAGISSTDSVPSSVVNKKTQSGNIFLRLYEWYKYQLTFKKIVIISVVIFCLVLLCAGAIYGFIIYKGYNSNNLKDNKVLKISPTPTMTPTPLTKENILTGESITGSQVNNLLRPPIAAMIENSIPARPQTGLNQADIVYESLAEGGITRFMAVFLSNTPNIIGPVRSARTYYLDFANEYNPIYTHWGENSDVIPSLTADNIRNLDAIVQPGTDSNCTAAQSIFCRDFLRDAPHNGYGFPARIWNYASSQGWTGASNIQEWKFKDNALLTGRGIDQSSINIDFMQNDVDYSVKWLYNKVNNVYSRVDNGIVQVDRADNSPITTKNIVIQFVDGNIYTSSGGKDVYHLNTIGTGKASLFRDGQEIDGTWKKDSLTGRTMFYDQTGAQMQFDRGRTWITVLVNNTGSFTVNN